MGWGYGQINQFDVALDHSRQAEQIYLPLVVADLPTTACAINSPSSAATQASLMAMRNAGVTAAAEFAKGIADYDVLLKAGPNKRYRIYQADLRMRMANALLAAGHPRKLKAPVPPASPRSVRLHIPRTSHLPISASL